MLAAPLYSLRRRIEALEERLADCGRTEPGP